MKNQWTGWTAGIKLTLECVKNQRNNKICLYFKHTHHNILIPCITKQQTTANIQYRILTTN